jgi:hypothetical protein
MFFFAESWVLIEKAACRENQQISGRSRLIEHSKPNMDRHLQKGRYDKKFAQAEQTT